MPGPGRKAAGTDGSAVVALVWVVKQPAQQSWGSRDRAYGVYVWLYVCVCMLVAGCE